MFLIQLVIVAVVGAFITIPFVLFIPRQRQSPVFDRVLLGGTWLLSILGAFAAPSYITSDPAMSNLTIAQMPVIPTLIGAAAGALSINVLLWLMDRFSSPTGEADIAELEDEEENDTRPDNSD